MRISFLLIITILMLPGCKNGGGEYLPGYAGNPWEIVVVMNKQYWDGNAGLGIKKILNAPQPGLPQTEPLFDLVNITHRGFGRVFQIHRNILLADISNEHQKSTMEVVANSWAKGQLVIKITAPDAHSFLTVVNQNEQQIIDYFTNRELSRLQSKNKKHGVKSITDTLEHYFDISLTPQKDTYIATRTKNFVWLRTERARPVGGTQHQVSQGIMVYFTEYNDTGQFDLDRIIALRDSISKQFIPGPVAGSFMTVSKEPIAPEMREISFKDEYAVEVRGLWKTSGAFMGGPFYSLTTIDKNTNRLITVDGYVFSPQFDKRKFIREVEAVARSLKFSGR